ncbi:hypothetical protein IU470_09065 [Nocardia abscessus]|uniref:Uncharacterized protein n=1 Tax=Nocardia abscessus TaxID=120957 RepID=A0ABS0C6X8_9NOCA|nr:hypothetical protein [Nocardia abscessus]MBF6225258.1 hypothetical protein [Nocardia abscessus]
MAEFHVNDLPDPTVDVLRRRARAAGLPLREPGLRRDMAEIAAAVRYARGE